METILVIEDDLPIRENIAEVLSLSNYKVLTASNGKLGVSAALHEHPDLIVCDIAMPVMDGYEVLYILSKNDSTADIPFIFLTAKTEIEDVRKGMNMGADDYLLKPFDEMDLLKAIDTRLKKRHMLLTAKDSPGEFVSSSNNATVIKDLLANKKIRKARHKEIIFMEDDEVKGVYYISKGLLKTYKLNSEGRELIMGIYKEGEFICSLDLLDGEIHKETAIAIEDCLLIFIPKSEFFSLIYSNNGIASQFIHMISNNINELKGRLLDLAYSSLRKRLANVLISLEKKDQTSSGHHILSISRENLANITGISPESVSRTLHEFKDEKMIDLKNKEIIILNHSKLESLRN